MDKPLIRVLVPNPNLESVQGNGPHSAAVYYFNPGVVGCTYIPGRTVYDIALSAWPRKAVFKRDAVRLDPTHNKVLFENDRVRVLRVHFTPGESKPTVDKRPRVIILLTDMHAVVTFSDGHSESREGSAGAVYFVNAGAQATKNVGKGSLENIVVELKSQRRWF